VSISRIITGRVKHICFSVPARHDPDASLETVDLNEDESGLEAFLEDIYDVSPLPRDESIRNSDSSTEDDVTIPVNPANGAPPTEDASLQVPGVGGDMTRTESMYYTPDTTMEKLSEVAEGK
jgi:hypothetical protein